MAICRSFRWLGLWVVLVLAACDIGPLSRTPAPAPIDVTTEIALENVNAVTGQTIYVPAYSEIYFADGERTLDLTVTLSIHNTDLNHPIILKSVRYYGNSGNLVKEYTPVALHLPPIATKLFVIELTDRAGGVGANFIVEWLAETNVTAPVVEAVHISAEGQQGLSFLSPGRVISELSD